MPDTQSDLDMNNLQFHQTRPATDGEVNEKQQKFDAVKQVFIEKLEQIKARLDQANEPIKGEERSKLIQDLHGLHTLFDRMDQASYEYFEKQEYGVVEPKG